MHDPDAPLAGGFTHWVLVPASAEAMIRAGFPPARHARRPRSTATRTIACVRFIPVLA
jgi:phosphatidylethanolamine-binding protein (PEBP) family uncharacterized protein